MKTINWISLFAAIGVLAVCVLKRKEGRVHGGACGEKEGYGSPFWLLLLYGLIAIRCIGLGEIPGGFNQDGAMGAVDAPFRYLASGALYGLGLFSDECFFVLSDRAFSLAVWI